MRMSKPCSIAALQAIAFSSSPMVNWLWQTSASCACLNWADQKLREICSMATAHPVLPRQSNYWASLPLRTRMFMRWVLYSFACSLLIVYFAVRHVRKSCSSISKQVDSIIGRAMAKDPAQRFQHPGELANAYHQAVAPGDKARKPFVIASPAPAQANPVVSRPMQLSSQPRRNEHTLVSRRRMLALVGSGAGAAVAIAAVAVFAGHYLVGTTSPSNTTGTSNPPAGNSPAQGNKSSPPATGGHVLAHTSDIPLNSAKTFPIANSQNPGLLIPLPNNQFVAFTSTCTHAGCPVSYNAQNKLLECPCHGAVFDPARNAAVVHGPATTPLTKIAISVHPDGTITQP